MVACQEKSNQMMSLYYRTSKNERYVNMKSLNPFGALAETCHVTNFDQSYDMLSLVDFFPPKVRPGQNAKRRLVVDSLQFFLKY